MSSSTVTPYDPNGMVEFLHHFPHVASGSNFNLESNNYLTSISILGVFFFLVFAFLVSYLWNLFFFRPLPRKSFFRSIHRNNVRFSIIILCVLVIVASVLGTVYGWRMSVKGLDGMIDDINEMSTLADNMANAGSFVVIGASELMTALEDGFAKCPDLIPIATSFNTTFLATTNEFEENSHALPDLLDDAKPKIRQAIRYVKTSLVVPMLLTAAVCLLDMLATFTNSPRINKYSRIAIIISTSICGIIVASEVALTVASGDFCHHADRSAVKLIGDYAGTNSTTYQTAEYYAFCESANPSAEDLNSMIVQLSTLQAQINALPNCTDAKKPTGDIMDRISISQSLAVVLLRLTACPSLHPVWVSLVHDHFCDKTLPGIAWLWLDHLFCLVVLASVSILGYDLMLSFRASLVFSSRSSRNKMSNSKVDQSYVTEATPLYNSQNPAPVNPNFQPYSSAPGLEDDHQGTQRYQ